MTACIKGITGRLILGDIGCCPDRQFGLVVLALSALGFVPTAQRQVELLTRITRSLRSDGMVAIDLPSLSALVDEQGVSVLQRFGRLEVIDAEVVKWMVQSVDWAEQNLCLTSFFDLTWPDRSTSRLTESVTMRWFVRTELALLLDRSGLEIEQVFGNYDGGAFNRQSERMIVIARRSGIARD